LPDRKKNIRGGYPGPGQTIADLVFPVKDPVARQAIESYRVSWESLRGQETDMDRNYTSLWPEKKRVSLMEMDLKKYFDGLPPFARDWMRDTFQNAARDGALDDAADPSWIELYVSGGMNADPDKRLKEPGW